MQGRLHKVKPVNTNKASKRGEDRGGQAQFTHNCPMCGARFTDTDVTDFERGKVYYILVKHGVSYRSIGRALGGLHPQVIKYHAQKFEETMKQPMDTSKYKQEFTHETH